MIATKNETRRYETSGWLCSSPIHTIPAFASLAKSLDAKGICFTEIGDCVAPRSAEEAIYEAYMTATRIN